MNTRLMSMLVGAAFAGHGIAMDFIDVAPVVSVTPLYGPVSDARECFVAQSPQPMMAGGAPGQMPPGAMAPAAAPPPPQERSIVAPVVGGVAGALVGSQVGHGRGRDAATAVGAVAGTVIADRVANPDSGGSLTGAIVGGGAGALLGNQVGSGSGRTAATAAGAIGGSIVGDRLMSSPPPQQPQAAAQVPMQQPQVVVDRCRTVDGVSREVLRGYSVVYRYNGRDITTTVPNHPGNMIRIAIGPLDNYPQQPMQAGAGYPAGVPVMAPQQPMMVPQPVMAPQPSTQQMLIQQAPALIAPMMR